MAVELKIKRSDRYPVGTSVSAYPANSRIFGGPPEQTPPALATAVVAADGSLTLTALTEGTPLALYALVAGEHRYLRAEAPEPVEPPPFETLQERIAKRRAEVGA
jgi:hypothetical protein